MNKLKKRVILSTGATSTVLGGTGAVLASMGLCGCTLAPIFSIFGIATILISFLTYYKFELLILGTLLLIISYMLYSKKTCKIHKKHNP